MLHPTDVDRVKTDDNYLNRFLLHHDNNLDSAFKMLWETCEWRKKFGVNGKISIFVLTYKDLQRHITNLIIKRARQCQATLVF